MAGGADFMTEIQEKKKSACPDVQDVICWIPSDVILRTYLLNLSLIFGCDIRRKMMKRTLKIEIECGDFTCASVPDKFCKWIGSTKFGTIPVCMLFNQDNESYTVLGEINGWVKRCDACLDSENKNTCIKF